ncbi:hypothetical protein B0F90DRAFT_1672067 [Multifurca ochricompacta]|uniref:Uncharacterized protein n=1 Tax=Multifurca ochricompacta TaxID=376703 RepID=A0AAD4LWL1_9AGAM|nr:hypothetical protein B0F90DRAFT_1672067 [Multifurca ochricompacta]
MSRFFINGYNGLFVKQGCFKSGFKNLGFTGPLLWTLSVGDCWFHSGDCYSRNASSDGGVWGSRAELRFWTLGKGRVVVALQFWNRFGASSAPRLWFGFGVEARDASSSPCRFGFDVEVGLQETCSFKVGVRGSCAVVATFWVSYKGRLVVTLQFWSGNQDHWHPGSIRWSTSTTIKPRSQPRQNLAVKIKTMIKTDRRNQAAVSTSTTTKQRNQAAVNTSTTTKQGIEAAVNGSSSGVGVRDASSSPHAFVYLFWFWVLRRASVRSGCSDSKARAFAGVTGEPNPLKSHLGRGLKGLPKDL